MTVIDRTAPPQDRTDWRVAAVFAMLAGSSGAAVMVHAFFPVPMRYTVPFAVLPTGLLVVLMALKGSGRRAGLELISHRVALGAKWGLIATVVYDVVRPPLGVWFSAAFVPYKAMPIFGDLITGRGTEDLLANGIGWAYHFWNGICFGIMFSLVAPRAGRRLGIAWGLGLQLLMMATYPTLLGARLDDPGFMVTGIFGHAFWGYTLGRGLERERAKA